MRQALLRIVNKANQILPKTHQQVDKAILPATLSLVVITDTFLFIDYEAHVKQGTEESSILGEYYSNIPEGQLGFYTLF